MPTSSQKEGFPTLDSLSNLPPDVVANILSRLPIREAIQTCILSRQWRYKWCFMTRLYFDDDCVTLPDDDNDASAADDNDASAADDNDSSFDDEFTRFIDRVLLYLQGPVHEFTIATAAQPVISDLNQWVYYASRNDVRKLSLEFRVRYDVKAPSSLFRCTKLTSLHLSSCKIRELPVGFDGFMALKTLHFNHVEIQTSSFEKLISGCPILERLEWDYSRLMVFRVHAPLLKYLRLQSKVDGFFLDKTPLLRELVVITVRNDTVVKFLDNVPSLEKLVGRKYFMKHWSQCEDPATCAITLDHLRFIELDLNFENPTEVLQLLKLMDGSPILEDIDISARSRGTQSGIAVGSEFWSKAHDAGCKLLQLKKVKLTCYGSTNETEFMKLLLLNASVLKEMDVCLRCVPEDMKKRVMAELLRLRRASREAEVVCSGF